MSDTSTIRRIEILGSEVFESLIESIKEVEFLLIAIDEPIDKTDVAQLCLLWGIQMHWHGCRTHTPVPTGPNSTANFNKSG